MNLGRSPALAAIAASLALSFTATAVQAVDLAGARAQKARIEADAKAARSACDSLSGNAKDICVAEARGKEKVALAELEHAGASPADASKVAMARADATYAVAKERCDDLSGNAKDVCLKDARAAHTRAKADTKASRTAADARGEAASDKRDADYKAARERCDAMSGNAKDACISAAKARFGKD